MWVFFCLEGGDVLKEEVVRLSQTLHNSHWLRGAESDVNIRPADENTEM